MTTILYVEDNEANVFMLERRLRRAGFDVVVARNGEDAVHMATASPPDLIVMDLSLPLLDGWAAARRLRSQPETAHVPIIALSAHVLQGSREQALAAGCDEFEPKPVNFPKLLEKIRAALVNPRHAR